MIIKYGHGDQKEYDPVFIKKYNRFTVPFETRRLLVARNRHNESINRIIMIFVNVYTTGIRQKPFALTSTVYMIKYRIYICFFFLLFNFRFHTESFTRLNLVKSQTDSFDSSRWKIGRSRVLQPLYTYRHSI